jgi:hypothetical protein
MTDWNLAFKRTMPGLIKALIWCCLNILFGLLPILLLLMLGSMAVGKEEVEEVKHKLEQANKECVVMFFFCAIMGAALVDFVLSKVRPRTNLIAFCINVSPLGMLMLVVILYINAHNQREINYSLYNQFQTYIVAFSTIYCMVVKSYLYSKEKEMEVQYET